MPFTAFLCLKISLMNSLKFTVSTVAVCRNFERLNKHYVRGTKSEGSGIWSKYLILYSTVMCRAMEMLRISQLKRKQVAFFCSPGYCSIFLSLELMNIFHLGTNITFFYTLCIFTFISWIKVVVKLHCPTPEEVTLWERFVCCCAVN